VRELDKLGGEDADVEKYLTTLARAFWVLHRRPERRGVFRIRYVMPEVDEEAAWTHFKKIVPRADLAVKSLALALFGLVEYVTGNGEKGRGV
jgi:hypothetical protein